MYEEQYPDSKFNLEHPFDFSDYEQCELNKSEQDLFDAHISKYKPEFIDQHLRYPADDRTVAIHLYLIQDILKRWKKNS